jgi:hypothetical protein
MDSISGGLKITTQTSKADAWSLFGCWTRFEQSKIIKQPILQLFIINPSLELMLELVSCRRHSITLHDLVMNTSAY